jgi:3-methylfumaryl-CoA hydratase
MPGSHPVITSQYFTQAGITAHDGRMSRDVAQVSLADMLEGWRPGSVEMTRRVDPWFAAAFADLLDAPGPVAQLPPLWHWFVLLEHPAGSNTGADGHPADAPFLPPIPGRRRMFAGGRLRQRVPIPLGAELSSRAGVSDVRVKSGRTGEMAFVTVRHELFVDGAPVGVDEQDIVYRSEPPGTPTRTLPPPGGADPEGEWRVELATDPVVLFRFSALTYNGHRIHYEQPYATQVEGYPNLVVHGPLLALLALERPRRHAPDRPVRSFEYRLVRPAFVPSRIVSAGRVQGSDVDVVVGAQGAGPSLTAKVGLA